MTLFTYKDTAVVTPNADTPYSMLWLDLRAEPIVISVPAVDPKRYYSVQLIDSSTYNYGYIGSRATGSDAGDYLVVGPNWRGETPAGVKKAFKCSSQHSLAIFRTQLLNAADMDNVIKVQDGYKARPLSAFLNQAAPPAAPAIDFPKIDDDLAKTKFFDYLAFMMQFMPPMQNEDAIRADLAKIGVEAGKPFSLDLLRLDDRLQILVGMKMADRRIDDVVNLSGKSVNGWRIGLAGGDAAAFNGDWLKRAAVAKGGIYANDPIEAAYPFARTDDRGRSLDGKRKYTLTFPANGLPPVNAFWSVTIYDGKTQLLVKNPIDRYLINSPMLPDLKTEPGRLDHDLHPERLARPGQGSELAAGAGRLDLYGHAPLLAEDDRALHPPARAGNLEAARGEARGVAPFLTAKDTKVPKVLRASS